MDLVKQPPQDIVIHCIFPRLDYASWVRAAGVGVERPLPAASTASARHPMDVALRPTIQSYLPLLPFHPHIPPLSTCGADKRKINVAPIFLCIHGCTDLSGQNEMLSS